MITVIHSCTSNSFSGLERYVLEMANWQYQNGCHVIVYCRKDSQIEREALKLSLPVFTIEQSDSPNPLFWFKVRAFWNRVLSKNGNPVFLHMHAGGEPLFHLPWLPRVTNVLQYHIWINHNKRDPIHWALYSLLDEIWVSCESALVHMATLFPVPRQKFRVIPYGRDSKKLKALPRKELRESTRREFKIPMDAVVGLCISRFEKIKGIRELFDAAARVLEKNPKAHLLLVGDASPQNAEAAVYTAAIRKDYQELSDELRSRIHLPGFFSPPEPLFTASDFYIVPSYEECVTLSLLDSTILGLPMIGTRSGGTPSVVFHEETGLLVSPQNTDDLSAALDRMYRDGELRSQFGKNALVYAPHYDQQSVFSSIVDAYQACINTKQS